MTGETAAPPAAASDHPAVARYAEYVNPAFVKLLGVFGYGRVFTRALDAAVWDHQGRRYLDFLAGFGAANLGHNHPRLVERLRRYLGEEALSLVHVGPSVHVAELAEALARIVPEPLRISLFATTGAEAVEAGLKLARAATRRPAFVYCAGGFHGTNLGTLSVMGVARMRGPFEPLLDECVGVPFGDLPALEKALAPKRAAGFVVEPIQGEGGVVLPPAGYLKAARDLCRRHGTLFILDEVQTGLGRTGMMFACEAEGVAPDVLALGKSLGGSIAPVSAAITSAEIHDRAYGTMDRFDLHGSTFAGNSFGCAAALETLRILADEGLVAASAERGRQLLDGLRVRLAGHPLVREVRGRGLLVGIELGATDAGWTNRLAPFLVDLVSRKVFGQWLALRLLEEGILCQPASQHWNVLKLEPPLTVQAADIDLAVAAVGKVLDEYRGLAPLLKDVTGRVGRQFMAGWKF